MLSSRLSLIDYSFLFFIFPQTKKSFGASKKLHLESPAPPKTADSSPSAKQLAASVESFANYLKHIVRPGNEEVEPPVRWSDDEPARSVSRTSFRRTSDEHRLSRERALQAEVDNWQLAWKDEKKRNDKLIADMASREKEWSRREEKCRLEYESQIHELKQELFVVQARLNETEKESDSRKRVAAGGSLVVRFRYYFSLHIAIHFFNASSENLIVHQDIPS